MVTAEEQDADTAEAVAVAAVEAAVAILVAQVCSLRDHATFAHHNAEVR